MHQRAHAAAPAIWLLELHNGEDSRINETLINKALHPALDVVERDWRERWRSAHATKDEAGGRGALVIVGKRGQNKFFSNGMQDTSPAVCARRNVRFRTGTRQDYERPRSCADLHSL